MNDETLEQIQTKIAFLEGANADLCEVVFRQQQEIKALGLRLKEMSDRLDSIQTDDRQRPLAEEKPPHY
jgi:uncharacterized coiled-coil protein SlyX